MTFWFIFKEIRKGNTPLRACMHETLQKHALHQGSVLDVGGSGRQEYLDYFENGPRGDVITVDLRESPESGRQIDFETDKLPFEDSSMDQVLCMNVLEHIFNYQLLTREMHRVLKPAGELIGFVPFLINYHPDPHDYFRYTGEALARILAGVGFSNVSIAPVGGGPFLVNYNTTMMSFPMFIRLLMFPFFWLLDSVFLALRPRTTERLPLGYTFVSRK
jgi:SAM-dependent methyltransferase